MVTTPWSELTGAQILDALEGKASLAAELARLEQERLAAEEEEETSCGCHHHEHEEQEAHEEHHCCHHHDHEHNAEHHCCRHHDQEHGEEHHCGHHHGSEHDEAHHGENQEHHCCHEHHHDGHHHHHADEVFTSWGVETARKFTREQVQEALSALDSGEYGMVLRAKGIVPCQDGSWIHFDYVPGEADVRVGSADVTGKLCVIGAQLREADVAKLFGV